MNNTSTKFQSSVKATLPIFSCHFHLLTRHYCIGGSIPFRVNEANPGLFLGHNTSFLYDKCVQYNAELALLISGQIGVLQMGPPRESYVVNHTNEPATKTSYLTQHIITPSCIRTPTHILHSLLPSIPLLYLLSYMCLFAGRVESYLLHLSGNS